MLGWLPLLLSVSCSLALAMAGASVPPPPSAAAAPAPATVPGYEKTVRSVFAQAHVIEVYVRYLDRDKKVKKTFVRELERVLRDRQTFGHIQDILLAHAAGAQAVERGPGLSTGSVYLIFDFKDANGKATGHLLVEEGNMLIFDPGEDFEVDREVCRQLVRLFVLHGDRVK